MIVRKIESGDPMGSTVLPSGVNKPPLPIPSYSVGAPWFHFLDNGKIVLAFSSVEGPSQQLHKQHPHEHHS
jgi:hypothetical protein